MRTGFYLFRDNKRNEISVRNDEIGLEILCVTVEQGAMACKQLNDRKILVFPVEKCRLVPDYKECEFYLEKKCLTHE